MDTNEYPRESRPLIETEATRPGVDTTLNSPRIQEPSLQQVRSHDTVLEDEVGSTDCAPTGEKFRRANADPFVVIADILCVLCPVGFLVFAVALRRLEGSATDGTAVSNWRNAVAIVSCPGYLSSIAGLLII